MMRGFSIKHHTTIPDLRSTAPHSPPSTTHIFGLQKDTYEGAAALSMGHCHLQAARQQVQAGIQDSQRLPNLRKESPSLVPSKHVSSH